MYGIGNILWSNRPYTSDEGWYIYWSNRAYVFWRGLLYGTPTDQTEHTLLTLTRVGVWYKGHFLIKQSIHFRRGLIYGTEKTNWSNRAYTSDEGWRMVHRTLTDQIEHILLTRVGVRYRGHLLIKQRIHFWQGLLFGTEITYWPNRAYIPDEGWCMVKRSFRRGLIYGTENTNWSNSTYTSDKGWCWVQRSLTDQTEHTLTTRVGVW